MQRTERSNKILNFMPLPSAGSDIRATLLLALGGIISVAIAYLITHDAVLVAGVLAAFIPLSFLVINYPFAGIIIWLLLMPFISIIPNSDLVYWVIYRLLIPVILVLVLLHRLGKAHAYQKVIPGPAELAMVILFLTVPAAVLLFQAEPFQSLIRFGDSIILPFCMYLVIRLVRLQERELHLMQWTGFFIIITQSFIGFLSWFAPSVLPQAWRRLSGARTTGSLMDADLYSAMLIFCAVLLIHNGIQRKSGMVRFLFFAVSGLSAVFVFLSLERAAWLGGLFVVAGLVFLFQKEMLRLLLIGGMIAVILGTGLLSTHVSLSVDRFSETEPIYDRFVVMDAMVQMIEEKPVLGWSYGTLEQNIQQFYRKVGEGAVTRKLIVSHNTFMTLITELGLAGFFLYMFPVFWWLLLSIRVWRRIPKDGLRNRNLLGVFWLSLLFNFIVSNFIDMRYLPIGMSLWWISLGLIANMVYPYLKNVQAISPVKNPLVQD